MIISILNEKGGVGKTTLSVNISCAMAKKGYETLLVDSDTQGSAREWHTRNEGKLVNLVSLDTITIAKDIQPLKKLYDRIIIDGAGWGSVDSRSIEMAVKTIVCSDIVIIPVQPSPYDVWGSSNITELVKQRIEVTEQKFKAFFVLNQCPPNAKISDKIYEELHKFGLPILTTRTYKRVGYPETASTGGTVLYGTDLKAKEEITKLTEEIDNVIKSIG